MTPQIGTLFEICENVKGDVENLPVMKITPIRLDFMPMGVILSSVDQCLMWRFGSVHWVILFGASDPRT